MQLSDLPPRKEWYRPPSISKMCPLGDTERYLLIAEIERGKIVGVGYQVSYRSIIDFPASFLGDMARAAEEEMMRRIERDDFAQEGSSWERFEWTPQIFRMKDGTYEIQNT